MNVLWLFSCLCSLLFLWNFMILLASWHSVEIMFEMSWCLGSLPWIIKILFNLPRELHEWIHGTHQRSLWGKARWVPARGRQPAQPNDSPWAWCRLLWEGQQSQAGTWEDCWWHHGKQVRYEALVVSRIPNLVERNGYFLFLQSHRGEVWRGKCLSVCSHLCMHTPCVYTRCLTC